MNKFLTGAGILLALFTNSCSTDFDLNADYQETPVIYALLDASQDTQYIRINRAYLSDEDDALTLALDPNSIYYGVELTTTLEEYNSGSLVATFPLQRVNGDTLGLPKQEGLFTTEENILYRTTAVINPDHSYKIVAVNSETDKSVSAETQVIDVFRITRPDDESVFPFSFALSPQAIFQLRWENAQDAKIYDITLRLHYREGMYFAAGDSVHITNATYVDWLVEKNYVVESTTGGTQKTYDVDGESFYQWIADTFDPVADFNYVRIADSVQFILDAGGQELYDYIQFNNASLGITEGEVTDVYTNVNGGLGVVSSRYHKVGHIYPLAVQTRDSIACSSLTSGLNFAPDISSGGFPFCE